MEADQRRILKCCDHAKRYKIHELRDTYSQKLIDAAASSFTDSTDIAFDADSALALITQAKLSKYQYEFFERQLKILAILYSQVIER